MNLAGMLSALADVAKSSGLVERALMHEPIQAPGSGISAAFWAATDFLTPVQERSGLAATSVRALFHGRLYAPLDVDSADAVEQTLMAATDALLTSLNGAFTLGGLVANIDLLGAFGIAVGAEAGYVNFGDGWYRTITISLPLVINDAWMQAP